ncbi:unnamed protein product [Prorocentrum cordatum]|uniref:Altered inheritance of mitochondria protein 24, mitochondrial n=1 Tax=Prorocentrum cordatum TaxID=2364126 RepID=A0ABN9QWQ8_9DINO|nr:unnamed protein product [Polarella glacialis]
MAVAARPAPTGYVVLGAAPHPVALAAGPPQPAAARAEPPHTAPTAPGPDAAAGSAELVGLAPAAHGVVADAGQAFRGLTSAEPSACSAIVSLQASGTTAGAHHYPTGYRTGWRAAWSRARRRAACGMEGASGAPVAASLGCCCRGIHRYLKQGAIVSMPAGDGIVFALTTEEKSE